MQTKQFDLIEAKTDEAGTFTALVSAFGNEDSQGDRVIRGAFKKSIEKMRKAGRVLPIVASHKHDDPMATVGTAQPEDIKETSKGLEIKASLDLENPMAAQIRRLFKSKAWTGMSFGYSVLDEREGKDGVNELTDLELIEAGPCLKGANPAAQLQEAKSALGVAQEVVIDAKDLLDFVQSKAEEKPEEEPKVEEEPEEVPAKKTDAPWDGSPARFNDSQYARACVLDRADGDGSENAPAKNRYSLPIREPSGTLNRQAVKEVAMQIGEGQVDALPPVISKAKGRLRSAYSEMGEDTPPAIAIGQAEAQGEVAGLIKDVWTIREVDALPDSAFLFIEQDCHLDETGKSLPRRKRHFPFKTDTGLIDESHLKAWLEQIPQVTFVSEEVKERLQARAKRILNIEDAASSWLEGRAVSARPRDPLKDRIARDRLDDLRR